MQVWGFARGLDFQLCRATAVEALSDVYGSSERVRKFVSAGFRTLRLNIAQSIIKCGLWEKP